MFKIINKTIFLMLLGAVTAVNASAPNLVGDYIGVTDINDTAVYIEFLDNSNDETGFRIFGDINQTLPENNETANPYVKANLTNLICDHTYSIQALAFKGNENSIPSDVRTFNIHTTFGVDCNDTNGSLVPNAPGSYIGVTDINDTAVRIEFLDNSNNETNFRIFGDINQTLPENNETANPYVQVDLTNLTCNQIYSIQALAFNASGDSLPTDVRTFNIHTTFGVDCNGTNGGLVPNAPGSYIGVTDINDTAVRIEFLDNSANETGFRIFGDINQTLPENNETANPYVQVNLTNLDCNQTYSIQALAFNNDGNSTPSDERTFNIYSTFGVPCN